MSWLRTAVHKAVGGKKTNISRIRNYADSVVQHAGQAVAGSAKLLQDRIGSRNVQNFGQTAKRLEELSVTCRGDERVFLLRRWLASLQEAERINRGLFDDREIDSKMNDSALPTLVLYNDIDLGGEPLTFHDVFLHSEALEGIILSMILDAPNDEEVALLMEIFGLCLLGSTDVHTAIVSSIQDLAKVYSCYKDEVLMKRDELLRYAQSAISGLKISAELERIDVEVESLKVKLRLNEIKIPLGDTRDRLSEEPVLPTTEDINQAFAQLRLYSKLKALLQEKRHVHNGDSPEAHSKKVDKLKILLESLASSTAKAEKRIQDHRCHKLEALSFRKAKVNEVSQVEKDLEAEVGSLQKQKDELEAELRKVTASLASANARLHNAREERQQFDEASSEILQHLQTKEEELLRSIASCKIESDVAAAWISFVESTWRLQSKFSKQKEDHTNAELRKYAEYFSNLSMQLLPAYKIELEASIGKFRQLVEKLKLSDWSDYHSDYMDNGTPTSAKKRKQLTEDYLDLEAKLIATFSFVESIKQLHAQNQEFCCNDNRRIEAMHDDIAQMRIDFDSIERPDLRIETPTLATASQELGRTAWGVIARKLILKELPSKLEPIQEQDFSESGVGVTDGQEFLNSDEEIKALESEFIKIITDNTARELNGWEKKCTL